MRYLYGYRHDNACSSHLIPSLSITSQHYSLVFYMLCRRDTLLPLPQFTGTRTCAGIEDGNIGKLVQLIELDVSLSLFTVMIYLQ